MYCGPTEQSLRGNESGTLKPTDLNERSGSFHHERFRRDSFDAVTKCSDSQCFGNYTTIFTFRRCYCRVTCYKIFSDCCPDYEKQCGRQQLLEDKTSVWKCVEYYVNISSDCRIPGSTGVWMISKCPADWRLDELRTKCENVPLLFSGHPIEDFIPVVGVRTSETYRNKHCAVCNGVENHTSWDVRVSTNVIPPDEFDLDSKLKFIKDNGGQINSVLPGRGQPWRFCFGRNFKDNCSSTNHSRYKDCVEGPVEVVGVVGEVQNLYFKNSACAICNGYNINSHLIHLGPWSMGGEWPTTFSIVFSLEKRVKYQQLQEWTVPKILFMIQP